MGTEYIQIQLNDTMDNRVKQFLDLLERLIVVLEKKNQYLNG